MKISGHVQAIINAAYHEAKVRNHEYLTPEHILYAALAFDEVQGILSACGANLDMLKDGMENYFKQKVPSIGDTEPTQPWDFRVSLNEQCSKARLLRNISWMWQIFLYPFMMKNKIIVPIICVNWGLNALNSLMSSLMDSMESGLLSLIK